MRTWSCKISFSFWISMASSFKKVKLVILTDISMLLMVQNGVRGGICHLIYISIKANNKYI